MANARKILILDDETDLRDTLVEQLSLHDEFEASAVDTGAKGASAAKANSPDLVLMDVGLPDTDGREVVRSLRKGGFKAPIIMLTGHDTDSDTILGLESGANDYVAKPFRFAVLLARIRAQLRQHEASEDAVFSVGPYSFRPGSKMLTGANARKVRLTEKETAILRFLYRPGHLPVSRETLLQEVWGYNSGVTTHTLETHIYRLRQKIEKDAANPEILVTEAGGYQLVPGYDSGSDSPLAGPDHRFCMSIEDDVALLERVATLRLLGTTALRMLAIGSEQRNVARGDKLFTAGDDADSGFIVQRGSFRIADDHGAEVVAGPGDLIGELALLVAMARPSTATALEHSSVIRLARSLFQRVLESDPVAARRLRDEFANRTSQIA